MTGPFTQIAFFFHYCFESKYEFNHFEFDCEKGSMLDQAFICICEYELSYESVFESLKFDSENDLIWKNCSTLDQALFLLFLKLVDFT